MTIQWFTDADRQDMRDAEEERRVLYELELKYKPMRVMTAEERDVAVAYYREHGENLTGLPIDRTGAASTASGNLCPLDDGGSLDHFA